MLRISRNQIYRWDNSITKKRMKEKKLSFVNELQEWQSVNDRKHETCIDESSRGQKILSGIFPHYKKLPPNSLLIGSRKLVGNLSSSGTLYCLTFSLRPVFTHKLFSSVYIYVSFGYWNSEATITLKGKRKYS